MAAWRVARSITKLHQQLQAGSRAKPPATGVTEWGTIGDAVHDPTSDHAPHDFPGLGDNVVTAGDFPNAPALGLNAFTVLDDIRRSRDPRVKYGISNDQIFSSYATSNRAAWTWGPYNPNNPNRDKHYTHGHLSVVGDARADGMQPWATIGASAGAQEDEDDMGASTPPITIEREGPTSLTIPPVLAGSADPRPAWLNFCNETFGAPYGLRVWITTGNGVWSPLPGTSGGLLALRSGQRFSQELPKGTAGLSITRKAIDAKGAVVEPTADLPAYAGHLTCCIERGAVAAKS